MGQWMCTNVSLARGFQEWQATDKYDQTSYHFCLPTLLSVDSIIFEVSSRISVALSIAMTQKGGALT